MTSVVEKCTKIVALTFELSDALSPTLSIYLSLSVSLAFALFFHPYLSLQALFPSISLCFKLSSSSLQPKSVDCGRLKDYNITQVCPMCGRKWKSWNLISETFLKPKRKIFVRLYIFIAYSLLLFPLLLLLLLFGIVFVAIVFVAPYLARCECIKLFWS